MALTACRDSDVSTRNGEAEWLRKRSPAGRPVTVMAPPAWNADLRSARAVPRTAHVVALLIQGGAYGLETGPLASSRSGGRHCAARPRGAPRGADLRDGSSLCTTQLTGRSRTCVAQGGSRRVIRGPPARCAGQRPAFQAVPPYSRPAGCAEGSDPGVSPAGGPADEARGEGIPSAFRPKRNAERREAEPFSRDGWPLERCVGSGTDC